MEGRGARTPELRAARLELLHGRPVHGGGGPAGAFGLGSEPRALSEPAFCPIYARLFKRCADECKACPDPEDATSEDYTSFCTPLSDDWEDHLANATLLNGWGISDSGRCSSRRTGLRSTSLN